MPRLLNRTSMSAAGFATLLFLTYLFTTDRADKIRGTFYTSSTARTTRPCLGAIEAGRDRLYEVYSKSLAGVTHVAVCDWPFHHNSGDSAIWLGEMALLESLGKKVAYICGIDDCVKEDMDKALEAVPNSETAVLMHGGGNFGDLWTTHQQLRNRLIQEMPDRKIRHFPQTFEFDLANPSSLLEATMKIYASHPDIEVVARDTESHAAMIEAFPTVPVGLTPDVAFYIGYDQGSSLTPPIMRAPGSDMSILGLTGKHFATFEPASSPYDDATPAERSPFDWPLVSFEAQPTHDVLVLARYDKEGGQDRQDASLWIPPLAPRTVRITDWQDSWRGIKSPPKANYGMVEADGKQVSFEAHWNEAALLRVQWAMAKLSSGRFVISDRLHTEILTTLLGQAHIAVEDGHLRKMEKVIDTWLSPCLIPYSSIDSIAAGAPRDTDANTIFVHSNTEAVNAAKAWLKAEDDGVRWSRISE